MSTSKTSSSSQHRKPRSKSNDDNEKDDDNNDDDRARSSEPGGAAGAAVKKKEKKTRSKSHDDAAATKGKTSKRTGSKRNGSLGSIMSLEDGLSKVGGAPSLQRKDFGRNADDDDTFCGTGTVDGEVKRGKLHLKTAKDPSAARPNPFGKAASRMTSTAAAKDPFGGLGRRRDDNDDEDDSEADDIDFFAGTSNPFKDLKKKSPSKRTIL